MNQIELLVELKGEMGVAEFAKHVGASRSAISMILAGRRNAGQKIVIRLVQAYPSEKQRIMAVFFA